MHEGLIITAVASGVTGGAVLLYAWSYESWEAHGRAIPNGIFSKPVFRRGVAIGIGLVCLGFGLAAFPHWGKTATWAGLYLVWISRWFNFRPK